MIPILTTASTLICPHGGQLRPVTSNTLARVDGAPMLLETDVHPIVGCPFTVGVKYQPCVTARWQAGAAQARLNGVPVLLQTSVGLCYSAEQAPQGVAIVVQTQSAARAV